MRSFSYLRAGDTVTATAAVTAATKFLAGGTNLLDLMKEDIERPEVLIDVTRLDLHDIRFERNERNDGESEWLSIGALATNTATANHALVRKHYPLLTQAILAGASSQIRNMATNGGNLNQRTRCLYFYDIALPCNKRQPGSGCGALDGNNRNHAIFGWSPACVATHPSDMCVALAALDAGVEVRGGNNETRTIAFADYHRLPGDTPEEDHTLRQGEIITALTLPRNRLAGHSCYLKVRERTSYAFALVSVAAALELDGDVITDVRLAMGGVAHKPWRAHHAESLLKGKQASDANYEAAAEAEMQEARTLSMNEYKVALGRRLLVRALQTAARGTGV